MTLPPDGFFGVQPTPPYPAHDSTWNPPIHAGRRSTNGFAIASMILSFFGGILLSVTFGIVALVQIRKTGQGGKGMAITGLVVSGLWMFGIAIAVVVSVVTGAGGASVRAGQSQAVNAFHLAEGSCFNDDANSPRIALVTRVSCDGTHDAQVFGSVPVAGDQFPGTTVLKEKGSAGCNDQSGKYLTGDLNYAHLSVRYMYPVESSWKVGTHKIVCFYRAHTGRLTGDARKSGVPFTAEQQRYNKALAVRDALLVRLSASPPDSELAALAGKMVQANADALAQLSAAPWDGGAQPAVDGLVRELTAEQLDWRRAISAKSPAEQSEAIDVALDAGTEANGVGGAEKAVRTALGLADPF